MAKRIKMQWRVSEIQEQSWSRIFKSEWHKILHEESVDQIIPGLFVGMCGENWTQWWISVRFASNGYFLDLHWKFSKIFKILGVRLWNSKAEILMDAPDPKEMEINSRDRRRLGLPIIKKLIRMHMVPKRIRRTVSRILLCQILVHKKP